MIDLNLLMLYILAVIVMIAVPGPVAVMVVSAGVSGGARRALLTVAGTNLASLVLIALAALLVKGLLTVDAALFAAIKLGGALYVGYLGWGMLRACADSTFDGAAIGAGGFGSGFAVALSNPKDIVFFASFFPQFIGITPDADSSLIVLTVLWIALDFLTLMLMFQLISRMLRPGAQQMLLRGAGAVLVAVAVAGTWAAASELYVMLTH